MRFRQHQARAQGQTARLLAWFALLLALLTVTINLLLGLAYKLVMPFSMGFPALFFETNTAVVMLFVLGGTWVETTRLREGGGARVARWLGGREVSEPDDATERRLLNIVDEMALASGQPVPKVYVLSREDAINAFVAGWDAQDVTLCVTRGALDRLTRAELQGLVAHEFGHIKEDDLPLTMRMLAMVWGLSLIHGYGQTLMAPDEQGRARPLAWVLGLVFASCGWLGWMAGRLLQAAVARQREYLADACAVQFTRSKEGLGNVLRKLWHDEQVLAGRMRHPAADVVASLLVHGGSSTWLATHPSLPDRIERILGKVMPPLPAPLIHLEESEPRRPRHPADPDAVLSLATSADPLQRAGSTQQRQQQSDRDALMHLQGLVGPTERRLIVLALMTDTGNARERKLWQHLARNLPSAARILEDVAALLPTHRVPEFERVTASISTEPIEQRRTLVENARDLLRADGRVSPRERLWWLALRHRMGVQPGRHTFVRPVTGQGQDLHQLSAQEIRYVATLSAYLARFVPLEQPQAEAQAAGQAWYRAVLSRCTRDPQLLAPGPTPDADGLINALAGVQEMSWMIRPLLLKAWVEEAVNHSPHGMLTNDSADALRLLAGLIEAPLPPMLEAHYPRG